MVFKKLAKTFRKSVTKKEKKAAANGVTISSSSPVPEAVEFTKETSSRPNKKQSSQGTTKTQPMAEDGNAEDDFFMGDIDEDDEHSEEMDESTEEQIEKLKHKIEQLELKKSSKPDQRSTSDDDLVALAALSFSGGSGGGLTKTTKSSKHMSSIDLSSLAKQEEALQPRRARLPRRSSMKKLTELENDSSDQPSARFDKPQRRLSVGFSSCPIENSVEYTLHHKDMTNEEKLNVWMQTDCTTKIQQHCLQVVKTAETFGEEAVCTRGLEQYLSKNAHHREGQVEGVEEVLVEQEIQKQFGMSCADSIASAYKTVGKSDESQTRAHLRAMADQEEARAYLKTMQEDVLDTVHTRDEAKQYLLSLVN